MKSLNPNAEEWRPTTSQPSPLLPLPIIPPPFLPPSKLFIPQWFTYNTHPHPIYSISFPAITFKPTNPMLLGAADVKKKEAIAHQHEAGERSRGKTPRNCLPPRLQRAAPPKQAATSKVPVSVSQPRPPKLLGKQKGSGMKVPGRRPRSPPMMKTLMIRNIPSQLRRSFMLQFLDGYCRRFHLEYDFLYLPMDFRSLGNLGYCFINMTTAEGAVKLKKVLTNYKWRTIFTENEEAIVSYKVCEVSWARIQGKDSLIRRFENSSFRCNEMEFLPVVFDPPRNGSKQNPSPPLTLGRISQHL